MAENAPEAATRAASLAFVRAQQKSSLGLNGTLSPNSSLTRSNAGTSIPARKPLAKRTNLPNFRNDISQLEERLKRKQSIRFVEPREAKSKAHVDLVADTNVTFLGRTPLVERREEPSVATAEVIVDRTDILTDADNRKVSNNSTSTTTSQVTGLSGYSVRDVTNGNSPQISRGILKPMAMTTNDYVPAQYRPTSRSSSIGKAGNRYSVAFNEYYVLGTDKPASSPSSFRHLRRSKSFFAAFKPVSPVKAPDVVYTNGTPEKSRSADSKKESQTKAPTALFRTKSMNFLGSKRERRDGIDHDVQAARDRFLQQTHEQNLRSKPSFMFRRKSKISDSRPDGSESPKSESTNRSIQSPFGFREKAHNIKNKLRSVFGRKKKSIPQQQMEAVETHVREHPSAFPVDFKVDSPQSSIVSETTVKHIREQQEIVFAPTEDASVKDIREQREFELTLVVEASVKHDREQREFVFTPAENARVKHDKEQQELVFKSTEKTAVKHDREHQEFLFTPTENVWVKPQEISLTELRHEAQLMKHCEAEVEASHELMEIQLREKHEVAEREAVQELENLRQARYQELQTKYGMEMKQFEDAIAAEQERVARLRLKHEEEERELRQKHRESEKLLHETAISEHSSPDRLYQTEFAERLKEMRRRLASESNYSQSTGRNCS